MVQIKKEGNRYTYTRFSKHLTHPPPYTTIRVPSSGAKIPDWNVLNEMIFASVLKRDDLASVHVECVTRDPGSSLPFGGGVLLLYTLAFYTVPVRWILTLISPPGVRRGSRKFEGGRVSMPEIEKIPTTKSAMGFLHLTNVDVDLFPLRYFSDIPSWLLLKTILKRSARMGDGE